MRLWRDAHLQAKIEKKKVLPLKKTRRSGVRGALAEPDLKIGVLGRDLRNVLLLL